MFQISHSKSKKGHKNTDECPHSLYSTHIHRWNLPVCLQSWGWLSHGDISSSLNYNWQRLKLYKDPIFSHPLYVTLPHPLLKPAPKKHTKKWGGGEVIKTERRYEVKQKHVLQYIWRDLFFAMHKHTIKNKKKCWSKWNPRYRKKGWPSHSLLYIFKRHVCVPKYLAP